MKLSHPNTYWNGQPPENVFFVSDDLDNQVSSGYVVYQYLPHLYPDRPVNVFFQAEGERSGQAMLFGALIARARQLRDTNPGEQARIYTCIDPQDQALIDFYSHSGMNCSEKEVAMQLEIPQGEVHLPLGCSTELTPLYMPDQQVAFLDRLHQNDVSGVDATFLMRLMRTEHFHAVGLFCEGRLAGEMLVAGNDAQAELIAFYVVPEFRRRGLGTALCRWSLWALSLEGVRSAGARFVTRSLPQKALSKALGAREAAVTAVFPQLFM